MRTLIAAGVAANAGLTLEEIAEMPANNLTLVFGRSKTG